MVVVTFPSFFNTSHISQIIVLINNSSGRGGNVQERLKIPGDYGYSDKRATYLPVSPDRQNVNRDSPMISIFCFTRRYIWRRGFNGPEHPQSAISIFKRENVTSIRSVSIELSSLTDSSGTRNSQITGPVTRNFSEDSGFSGSRSVVLAAHHRSRDHSTAPIYT